MQANLTNRFSFPDLSDNIAFSFLSLDFVTYFKKYVIRDNYKMKGELVRIFSFADTRQ